MQPLSEHRQAFAGYETRMLELEGVGPGRLHELLLPFPAGVRA